MRPFDIYHETSSCRGTGAAIARAGPWPNAFTAQLGVMVEAATGVAAAAGIAAGWCRVAGAAGGVIKAGTGITAPAAKGGGRWSDSAAGGWALFGGRDEV